MQAAHAPLSVGLKRLRHRTRVATFVDCGVVGLGVGVSVAAAISLFGMESVWPAVVAGGTAGALRWRATPTLQQLAERLDEQHGLADLLGSAWAVRDQRNESWAAALWSLANARIATLPPVAWPGRRSIRRHVSTLALALALLLSAQLIRPTGLTTGGSLAAKPTAAARPVAEPIDVADILTRPAETAESDRPARDVPTSTDAAGEPTHRPARPPGDASTGIGQADTARRGTLRQSSANSRVLSTAPGRAGSGISAARQGHREPTGGEVATFPAANSGRPPLSPGSADETAPRFGASNVPQSAAYRDLVADFFAR